MAKAPPAPEWVIADTHFGLVDGRYRPPGAYLLVATAWRELVAPGGRVLHLGDVGVAVRHAHLLEQLGVRPGEISLVPGNWDDDSVLEACVAAGWAIRAPFAIMHGDRVVEFTHEPVAELSEGVVNVHGHLHPPRRQPYELTRQHLNVAAALHGWRPQRLADLLKARVAAWRPGARAGWG